MHANWKCQEWPRGTCITEPLVTATAANPTLAHSLFHAVRVSTFPGYQTSYLSMQQLYREKASVWFNSFHTGRGSAPNSNAWLMQKRKSIAETAHPPGPSGQKQTQQIQDATFFTCTLITFSLTSSDFPSPNTSIPTQMIFGEGRCFVTLIQDEMPAEIPFSRKLGRGNICNIYFLQVQLQ